MSSDSEEEFQENLESDREETDSIASIEDLDIDETQKKNDLLQQKLKLVLGYNATTLDLYEFNKSLKKINNDLDSIQLVTEYSNSDLVNREYSFIELLETYINEIKNKIEEEDIKDSLFLFCAGPLGNVLSHQLWDFNKNNTYLDIGSTLNIWTEKNIRDYQTPKGVYTNKICNF